MAEAAEIPEAKDPFERGVALTIAILAVALSVISMLGDNGKAGALLAATQASSKWAYFQSKSIKEHSYQLQKEAFAAFAPGAVDETKRQELVARYEKETVRYEKEKNEIKEEAEKLEKEVERNNKINDRCDLAGVLLQIAIVLGSVAILVRWKAFWLISIALGVLGVATAVTAFV